MSRIAQWLTDAEAKLDEWGKGAWITVMVLGFVFFWPVGLLILGYMIWSGRMGCSGKKSKWRKAFHQGGSTGNTAFDAYREETLRRLEDEQNSFEGFLGRLRAAKDKAEFDQFMIERRTGGAQPTPAG